MKKRALLSLALILALLAALYLWYTRAPELFGDHWDLRERRLLRRPASVRVLGG